MIQTSFPYLILAAVLAQLKIHKFNAIYVLRHSKYIESNRAYFLALSVEERKIFNRYCNVLNQFTEKL